MGEAAVTSLLEQVKDVVIGYPDVIAGAENEFNQLTRELGLLKASLQDAAMATKQEHLFEEMEKQIREVVYEVEDAIDACLTKAIEAQAKNPISCKPAFLRSRGISVAKGVKSIREEILLPMFHDVKIRFPELTAKGSEGVQDRRTKLKRDAPIRQNRVVGFEDEERIITGYLKEPTEKLDVITIVGIPGHGKTTLAWKIYQSDEICFRFPIRIWVNICQEFNSRDVFLQILKLFIPSQDTSSLNDGELAQTVRVCLEREKFLLVLDDVWTVEAWNEIKEVLPIKNGQAKVLITSRETGVGQRSSVTHKIKFLNFDESWELLQYEVFGDLHVCPENLEDIGKRIASKCDGVPLTILVIGGILIDQLTRSLSTAVNEWETVARDLSGALQSSMPQGIKDIVAMSYHKLPDDLRECFVYLGVFPEDYEIPAKTLCGLWIAEGYIVPKNGKSLEESAEENLNDLICRNLLKAQRSNHFGKAKTCRVDDMIRAFCIAKSMEKKMFQEIKTSKTGAFDSSASEVQNSRRVCLRSDPSKFLSQDPHGPYVRSFLCFYEQPVELDQKYISVIPDGFRKLRILESKCIKFHQFPVRVTKLIHLRYLTLYIETLNSLPEPITLLWNLQSLIVETKSRSITMRANMWRMVRLRHLKTRAAIVLDNKWEGEAGQNLHTLNRLAPESCTEAVYKRAKNLRTLGISGALANIFETGFLEHLHHLENLKLVNSVTYEQMSQDKLHRLPLSNRFPPNLKRLTLTNTYLSWQHMRTLAMIRSLEALKLKDNAFAGVSWRVDDYIFPNLELLLLVSTDLVIWDASSDSFPKLRFLVLKNCEKLKEIPSSVGTHLQKLEIERLCRTAVESAKAIRDAKKGESQGKFAVPFNLIVGPGCY